MSSPAARENEEYIIRIDTRREVPFSRYQELKGLSQSRVSQLKAEGKLQIRFIPFLNQELVVLAPEDYQLNQLLPQARQPAPSLSYRQLGGYFTSMLLEYESQLSTAERLSRQHQERAEQLAGQLLLTGQQLEGLSVQYQQTLDEKETLSLQIETLNQDNRRLISQQEHLSRQLDHHQQERQDWQAEREAWQQERQKLQQEIATLQTHQQVAEPFQTQLTQLASQVAALAKHFAGLPVTPASDDSSQSRQQKTSRKAGPTG
jgi:DNA repair exonuclease SbcCD ATPase subunit